MFVISSFFFFFDKVKKYYGTVDKKILTRYWIDIELASNVYKLILLGSSISKFCNASNYV